jgi:hypothetical protein
MNSRNDAARSLFLTLAAFVAGVIVATLCFVLRASIAELVRSSAFIPVACVLGALSVRAIESLFATITGAHAGAQRNGTA